MNGLYLAASGAASKVEALNISAHNMANSGTPGFRRFELAPQAVEQAPSPYQYASVPASPTLDMAQGPLRNSGGPLDVAVVGSGFIRVQTDNGGEAYTRNGQLEMTQDGALLAAGQPVMSASGGTITLPAGPITIAGDGSISVNGQLTTKISIADPQGATLVPIGSSLYGSSSDDPLPEATDSQLRQGFLEESGGNPITEATNMVSIMRSYESAINAVHTIDDTQQRAIQTFTLQA
ncbi:MAG TPA: flagellar hook basal-body protein [Candidatus Binataceae bacterium]|nr:flagellar hook basal-body protein [Candidatus Binataceae bacterium]